MEPKVIRTLKKNHEESGLKSEAERRKQVSDEILEIIYDKVVSGNNTIWIEGKGINALIDTHEE